MVETIKVCKSYPIPDGLCDLHALRDNVEYLKWGQQYADANIEVFDEYVTCADGYITVCKDVCDTLVLPATCSNDNEPIEVCETYATEKGYGICELADLHGNTDYINDGFKYSNAEIEVLEGKEVVKECGDGFITVCKYVCDEVNIRVTSPKNSINRYFRCIDLFDESKILIQRKFRYTFLKCFLHAFGFECPYRKYILTI